MKPSPRPAPAKTAPATAAPAAPAAKPAIPKAAPAKPRVPPAATARPAAAPAVAMKAPLAARPPATGAEPASARAAGHVRTASAHPTAGAAPASAREATHARVPSGTGRPRAPSVSSLHSAGPHATPRTSLPLAGASHARTPSSSSTSSLRATPRGTVPHSRSPSTSSQAGAAPSPRLARASPPRAPAGPSPHEKELEESLAAATKERDELKASLGEAMTAKVTLEQVAKERDELKAATEALVVEKAKLTERTAALETALAEAQGSTEKERAGIRERAADVERHKEELAEAIARARGLESRLNASREEQEAKRLELAAENTKLHHDFDEFRREAEPVFEKARKVDELTAELGALKQRLEEVERYARAQEQAVAEQKRLRSTVENQLQSLLLAVNKVKGGETLQRTVSPARSPAFGPTEAFSGSTRSPALGPRDPIAASKSPALGPAAVFTVVPLSSVLQRSSSSNLLPSPSPNPGDEQQAPKNQDQHMPNKTEAEENGTKAGGLFQMTPSPSLPENEEKHSAQEQSPNEAEKAKTESPAGTVDAPSLQAKSIEEQTHTDQAQPEIKGKPDELSQAAPSSQPADLQSASEQEKSDKPEGESQ